MVEGINIISPRLPGTGEVKAVVSKPVAVTANTEKTQAPKEATQLNSDVPLNVSSAIAKSAERRFESLSLGSTVDFLKVAEKLIDASLPNKPPGTRLRIDLDDESGRFVYQGIDVKTGDVVIQFPADELLKLIAFNRERDGMKGIVFDEEA